MKNKLLKYSSTTKYKACKKHQKPFEIEENMFGLTPYLALATLLDSNFINTQFYFDSSNVSKTYH